MNPDKMTALAERVERLSALKDSGAWAELSRIVAERKAHQYRLLQKALMNGVAIDQRHIDRMAGYFKGMEDLLAKPDQLEAQLERALVRAELFTEGDSE